MLLLIDTGLWIGLTREKSPPAMKRLVATIVTDSRTCVAEPIVFELLRAAKQTEADTLARYFDKATVVSSPRDLWSRGISLGRKCHQAGLSPGSLDLLIAVVVIEHGAELITFDSGFERIATVSSLRVQVLKRPTK